MLLFQTEFPFEMHFVETPTSNTKSAKVALHTTKELDYERTPLYTFTWSVKVF